MSCEHCTDPDGAPCFPSYGVGPHTCFYKIPGAVIGQSVPLPREEWPDNYREDASCPGMGIYWCPYCGDGKPDDGVASQDSAAVGTGYGPVDTQKEKS